MKNQTFEQVLILENEDKNFASEIPTEKRIIQKSKLWLICLINKLNSIFGKWNLHRYYTLYIWSGASSNLIFLEIKILKIFFDSFFSFQILYRLQIIKFLKIKKFGEFRTRYFRSQKQHQNILEWVNYFYDFPVMGFKSEGFQAFWTTCSN